MSAIIILATLSQLLNPLATDINLIPEVRVPVAVSSQEVSNKTGEKSANASQLLQQGVQLYQAQKFSEAVTVLQQSNKAFQASGDKLQQALALNYLSLAYQQLGKFSEAKTATNDSLKLLENKINSPEYLAVRAKALNTYGQLQLALGQSEQALRTWEQATAIYSQIGDDAGKIGSQINQSQALQSMGLYRRAQNNLNSVKGLLEQQPDSVLKATSLLNIARIIRVAGSLQDSFNILQESLAVAQKIESKETIAEILLELGNSNQVFRNNQLEKEQKDKYAREAFNFYRQVTATSQKPITRLQAQLNELRLLVETEQWSEAQVLWKQIQSQLASIPPSRENIYARINLTQSLTRLKQKTNSNNPSWLEIAQIVKTATEQAYQLQDFRAQAYTLGTLGNLYEQTKQYSEAEKLTEQALNISQGFQASDITYRWQWQLGRILKARGDSQNATIAYEKAVKTLNDLRYDLVVANRDAQFSFRDEVEPVYRELVSLLLQPQAGNTNEVSQENIRQAREVIEKLQVAELNDFFRKACLDTEQNSQVVQIDDIDKTAAVIYPVILPDRLAIILSLPNQPKDQSLRLFTIKEANREEVEKKAAELIATVKDNDSFDYTASAQQLYKWLIQPIDSDLKKNDIKNLVFVLDGSLRNLPMAVLFDGEKHLIQKDYNIAITPSLSLLPSRSLKQTQLQAIIGGLAKIPETVLPEDRRRFMDLDEVAEELKQIQNIRGENAKDKFAARVLLNEEFTRKNITTAVKSSSAPLVHLATHGLFSSNAEDTFILTADGRINVNQLILYFKIGVEINKKLLNY
ncbi:MAG: CHAT domain-containing protein [Calothrix sp. SM1_7_51]|nr:CHAT domain-containing protein [Calothrix sp. SM1_7_51]